MRTARVSASITFEIPYGLGLAPSPSLSHRSHARNISFFVGALLLTIITRFHDSFLPVCCEMNDLYIFFSYNVSFRFSLDPNIHNTVS